MVIFVTAIKIYNFFVNSVVAEACVTLFKFFEVQIHKSIIDLRPPHPLPIWFELDAHIRTSFKSIFSLNPFSLFTFPFKKLYKHRGILVYFIQIV